MKKPDYSEWLSSVGEVRYYCEAGVWRYVCADGEGGGFRSLEAAKYDVMQFVAQEPDRRES